MDPWAGSRQSSSGRNERQNTNQYAHDGWYRDRGVPSLFTESHSVEKAQKSMEADVADQLIAAACHNHGERAGGFHLVGRLLCGDFFPTFRRS